MSEATITRYNQTPPTADAMPVGMAAKTKQVAKASFVIGQEMPQSVA